MQYFFEKPLHQQLLYRKERKKHEVVRCRAEPEIHKNETVDSHKFIPKQNLSPFSYVFFRSCHSISLITAINNLQQGVMMMSQKWFC